MTSTFREYQSSLVRRVKKFLSFKAINLYNQVIIFLNSGVAALKVENNFRDVLTNFFNAVAAN